MAGKEKSKLRQIIDEYGIKDTVCETIVPYSFRSRSHSLHAKFSYRHFLYQIRKP